MPSTRTSIQLDRKLLSILKGLAAEAGVPLSVFIQNALADRFPQRTAKKPKKRKRVRLPTYGRGGLRPGVRLGANSNVEDVFDLEYADKLRRTMKEPHASARR